MRIFDPVKLLSQYYKTKPRLVLIIGKTKYDFSILTHNLIQFNAPEDISKEELSYLNADLIIVGEYQTYLSSSQIMVLLDKYTHPAGSIFVINNDTHFKNLIIRKKFQETRHQGIYTKQIGVTPKEYGLHYLKRFGKIDFLRNWKRAGEEILVHIPRNLKKESLRILDVGCLNGFIMETLRLHGVKNIYGNDISYELAVNNCINKYHLPAITIGDFCENHYPDQFSDLTIAMEILEHIPPEKTDKFISELKRVTANNGKILISTSEDMNIDPTHINCRKRNEWYYVFAKHGLIPTLRQTIFPGFNNFIFHKTNSKLKESIWINISKFIYILKNNLLFDRLETI